MAFFNIFLSSLLQILVYFIFCLFHYPFHRNKITNDRCYYSFWKIEFACEDRLCRILYSSSSSNVIGLGRSEKQTSRLLETFPSFSAIRQKKEKKKSKKKRREKKNVRKKKGHRKSTRCQQNIFRMKGKINECVRKYAALFTLI